MSAAPTLARKPEPVLHDVVAIASVLTPRAGPAIIGPSIPAPAADAWSSDPYERPGGGGDRGAAIAGARRARCSAAGRGVARTVAIDDLARASLAKGCDRVLRPAAGLDIRPHHLAPPATPTWIEADFPP